MFQIADSFQNQTLLQTLVSSKNNFDYLRENKIIMIIKKKKIITNNFNLHYCNWFFLNNSMKKELDFKYENYEQVLAIVNSLNPNFLLIETINKEKDYYVRGELWYVIKQRSNGLIFLLKTENKYDSSFKYIRGRMVVSLRILNKLNTFIYNQKSKIVRDILLISKIFLTLVIILGISWLIIIVIHKLIFIRIGRFNFSDSIYFQYPFLLIFWSILWGLTKRYRKGCFL